MQDNSPSRKRQSRARIGKGFANFPTDIVKRSLSFAEAARISKVEDAMNCLLDYALTIAEKKGHMFVLFAHNRNHIAHKQARTRTGAHDA